MREKWTTPAGSFEGYGPDIEELVRCHGRELLAYARLLTRHAQDAEDALQDALSRYVSKRRSRRENPRAYLYAAVRNAALNVIRSRRRRKQREDKIRQDEVAVFQEPIERAEELAALNAAMAALPEPQREVVLLKVWGGLTFEEIAGITGVPRATAASRYRYALDALRKELGAFDYGRST